MEQFQPAFTFHNLPYVLLSGLVVPGEPSVESFEHENLDFLKNGPSVTSEIPLVGGNAAQDLIKAFGDLDARNTAWNSRPGKGKMGSMGFTFKSAGRTLRLPRRKVSALQLPEVDMDVPINSLVLHSPISPLTPGTPLYPDGIMTQQWYIKHQACLPSTIAVFLPFSVNTSTSTLQDNSIKTHVNELRSWLDTSRYNCNLAIILVCDEAAPVSVTAERVGRIRRATNFETKNMFYVPGDMSLEEMRAFVGTLLSTIQPLCMEYYRDLSKHARRKKNRGSIPQPTIPPTSGSSHTLSARGWNVRYEMKLGVFAEFRGEMDAAERSYEQAYEDLVSADIFEGISSWSPRFNEARMLSDILAFRILRCLLWTGQTTSAAQSWLNHKYRMQTLVDRKGIGADQYSWLAWEAIWSSMMAQLIEKTDLPILRVPDKVDGESAKLLLNVYCSPERNIMKERAVQPWEYLHNSGYWHMKSAERTYQRRHMALGIPQEDRQSPSNMSASMMTRRSHLYDNYLCPEPHTEYTQASSTKGLHAKTVMRELTLSMEQFKVREQARLAEQMVLSLVQGYMEQQEWDQALDLAERLWKSSSWRRNRWWHLLDELYLAIYTCARKAGHVETLVVLTWELQSRFVRTKINGVPLLENCLEGIELREKPRVKIDLATTVPSLLPSFTFGAQDACVGDALVAQLTLMSCTFPTDTSLVASQITLHFDGSVGPVKIRHKGGLTSEETKSRVYLEELTLSQSEDDTTADLSFLPGIIKVFQFSIFPREAKELRIEKVVMSFDTQSFLLEIESVLKEPFAKLDWWTDVNGKMEKERLDLDSALTISVQPRPPKVRLEIPDLRTAYYTDEMTRLTIEIRNEEEAEADLTLRVRLTGSDASVQLSWGDGRGADEDITDLSSDRHLDRELGKIPAYETQEITLIIDALPVMADFILEVEADYRLASQPEIQVQKMTSQDLTFVRPFEANYTSQSVVHPELWPSIFQMDETFFTGEPRASGLKQRWLVTAKLASFSHEDIVLDAVELQAMPSKDASVVTSISKPSERQKTISPNDLLDHDFTVDIRKLSLEDRSPIRVQFQLSVRWRRHDTDLSRPANTTLIPAPALNLDFGKPRVLASSFLTTMSTDSTRPSSLIHLTYTLENPSDYLLTFNVAMEASEDFAFSGPKSTSVQLVPMSRSEVKYNLLPMGKGSWIRPQLKVSDVGFGKALQVKAAEGIRSDKRGGIAIWVPEEFSSDGKS